VAAACIREARPVSVLPAHVSTISHAVCISDSCQLLPSVEKEPKLTAHWPVPFSLAERSYATAIPFCVCLLAIRKTSVAQTMAMRLKKKKWREV